MNSRVRFGRGPQVRVLVAILVLGVAFSPMAPRSSGAAQGDADAGVPDIQAMTLTPEDLADEGLEGYGLGFAETSFPDQVIASTAAARGLDEDEVGEILEDAGFARRYDSYLNLPDEDDPAAPTVRQIISYVLEFADEDGAEAAFAFLEDESDNEAAEDVSGGADIGDESEATRDQGEDQATGDEYAQIDLTFRLGNLHAGVAIVDWQGDEPDIDEVEALAEHLLERVEETIEDGGPGLGTQVARLTGDGIVTSADSYTLLDGDAIAAFGESRADSQGRTRAAADVGQTDGYQLWQQLFAGEEEPDDDVWYQVDVWRFADEDAAEDWLADTEDRVAANQLLDNLDIDDGSPAVGDESVIYTVETEDGGIRYQSVALRVDATVAVIDVSAPESPPAAAVVTLAEAQAECLDDGACPEPFGLPAEFDDFFEGLDDSGQTENGDDDDVDETPEADGDDTADATPEAGDDDAGSANVPMFRADPARTGQLPGSGPAGDPELSWSLDTGDDADSTAAVVGGVLYVGSSSGTLFALDAATGDEVWTFATEGQPIQSSPAVVDGVVYIGSYDAGVYALEAETGEELWRFETGDAVRSSPAVVDGLVYIGSGDGNVYAIDAETGEEAWRVETGGEVYSSPAVVDGVVYVGSQAGGLYALEAETGDELWLVETGGSVWSSPAVVGGIVFFGVDLGSDVPGAVVAVGAEDGEEVWRFETGDRVWSSPAVVAGVVYAGSQDGNLYALEAETGDEVWAFDASVGFSSPVVADGVVYIGGGHFLHAVDAESGEELWSFEAEDSIAASPTVAGGVVYVGSGDDTLYAVGGESA